MVNLWSVWYYMKTCVVGYMKVTFFHESKEVEIKLVDEKCGHTLVHYMDYDDWIDLKEEVE